MSDSGQLSTLSQMSASFIPLSEFLYKKSKIYWIFSVLAIILLPSAFGLMTAMFKLHANAL